MSLKKLSRNKEIISKYINNISINKIAKEYGVSRQRIYALVVYENKQFRKRITAELKIDKNKIKELRTKGCSWMNIAKELKIGYNSLNKHINKNDYPKWNVSKGMKRCAKCKEIKSINEFSKDYKKVYHSYCKSCMRKIMKNYYRGKTDE